MAKKEDKKKEVKSKGSKKIVDTKYKIAWVNFNLDEIAKMGLNEKTVRQNEVTAEVRKRCGLGERTKKERTKKASKKE